MKLCASKVIEMVFSRNASWGWTLPGVLSEAKRHGIDLNEWKTPYHTFHMALNTLVKQGKLTCSVEGFKNETMWHRV